MPRFSVVSEKEACQSFLAENALAALDTPLCRHAPIGTRLVDTAGVTLATRERIEIDGAWLTCWRRGDAWPVGIDGPITLPTLDVDRPSGAP